MQTADTARLPRLSRERVWVLLRFLAGSAIAVGLLRLTLPWWSGFYASVAPGVVKLFEPGVLTTGATLIDGDTVLRFDHVYVSRVPMVASVALMTIVQGVAVWAGLALAVPGVDARGRLKDLLRGGAVLVLVSVFAVAARVIYQYATITQPPFPELFDNWRGWTAYFLNLFLSEVGVWVLPLALAALWRGKEWRAWLLPEEVST